MRGMAITEHEAGAVKDLVEEGNTNRQISDILSIPFWRVKDICRARGLRSKESMRKIFSEQGKRAVKANKERGGMSPATLAVMSRPITGGHNTKEMVAGVGVTMGRVNEIKQALSISPISESSLMKQRHKIWRDLKPPLRLAVCGDTHFPNQAPSALAQFMFDARKERTDAFIHMGDAYHFESLGKFLKSHHTELEDEFLAGGEFWRWVWKTWRERSLYLRGSNHEFRLTHALLGSMENLTKTVTDKMVIKKIWNVIHSIKDDFFNEDNMGAKIEGHDGWWVKVGNVILAHPHNFLKLRGATARSVDYYFQERGIKYNALFIAHTHRYSPPTKYNGRWMGEIPCLQRFIDYQADPHCKVGGQETGWALISIDKNGDFVPNASRWYYYDTKEDSPWQSE